MMNTEREESILRMLARGGLDTRQVARLENDLHELRESRVREQQWRQLTVAPVQPRFRSVDSF
jgi:2-polyprenyl-3-methyl-5-hydroxy-6-metoxy-1,4-benzoquinol methylase